MGNEDGTVWITFNGEVYNYLELRPSLESSGHRFATRSDTEVILHAYEEYGSGCVGRLRGMFAFAIWDAKDRTLFLARDRVGKKPLFYTSAGGQFLFASELQSLLEHPSVSRKLDPTALDDYLTYGYVPSPKTIFQNVFKLPPACTLTLAVPGDGSGSVDPRVDTYWKLEYEPKLDITEEEAEEQLLEVMTEAVRLRMIADVPLGALLSGGIDSSLVVALMSRLSDRPVKTFSIGFEERAFNELPYARLVAERYGTDHHELVVRPNALEILPTLVRHYGEPYADSSAVPSYYVSQMTRQHVTVALNGDGGDESFAGYELLLRERARRKIPQDPRTAPKPGDRTPGILDPCVAAVSQPLRPGEAFPPGRVPAAGPALPAWVTYFTPGQKRALYSPEYRSALGGHDTGSWLLQILGEASRSGFDRLDCLLATDVRSYLPEDLLVKIDIATMANSLEARSPLLDHKVMEFAARLPVRFKLCGTTGKYLLKRVARKLLPRQCLVRRKMGFSVPVGDWMRGELRPLLDDMLLSPRALTRGYFRPDTLRLYVREHDEQRQDHTSRLWALLWLEMWHREFVD